MHGATGTTLILNDLVGNIRGASGFSGWFLRLMGFAGDEPHIPFPIKRALIESKAQVREQLLTWAAMSSLRRIPRLARRAHRGRPKRRPAPARAIHSIARSVVVNVARTALREAKVDVGVDHSSLSQVSRIVFTVREGRANRGGRRSMH